MSEATALALRAAGIFPNQGMHRNAHFIAALHDNAIDYLEQAPVLAASFGVKFNSKADRLYIASRIGGPISRGERLRSVMTSVGLATPLRKLKGFAISPGISEFVRDLNDLSPSTLSQSIPERPGPQRAWLSSLRAYRFRMCLNNQSGKLGFSWIAKHAARCESGQASDIADFIIAHRLADFDRWSFERMENEVQLWHDRLASERGFSKYGRHIKPTTVIDLSDWPEHLELDGFEFFKLSTPSMIIEEGRRMRHCVASYIPQVMAGRCHLYSIRRDMRRLATMEIAGKRVVQLKAFGNKLPANGVAQAAGAFVKSAGEAA